MPLWKRRLTTLADLFRQRYSPGVERFAVLLMVPTSLLWAAAQVRAFGQVIAASSDLAVNLTITIAALVEQASAFGSAGIFVVVAFGLFTRWGDARSAFAALLAGVVVWVLGSYVLELPFAYIAALLGAGGAYVIVAVVGERPTAFSPRSHGVRGERI